MAFKVADGYVEIHVRYERGKLNKAAEDAGTQAGNRFSDRFQRSTERGMKKNLFGKNFMQREAGLAGQSAGRAFSQKFKDVTGKTLRKDLTIIEKSTVRHTRGMGRRFGKSVADGVGSSMTSGLKRWWNESLDLTKGHLVMIAGAVAAFAPTIGATLATGITLAFGAGIAGLGIYAAWQAKEVKQAFRDLGTDVGKDFLKMTKPIQSALIRVTDQAWDLHKNLKSSFSSAFEDVAATLDETTPKIVDGFSSWGPVIQTASKAFRNLMKATDFEKIIDDLGGAFGRLFKLVRDNPDSFAGIIEGAASLVTGLIDLTTWLADTYVKFEEDLGPAVDDFEASMSPLVDLLKKFGEEIGPIASQAIEDMISSFGDAQDVKDAKNEIEGTKSAIESITGWFVKADNGFRKFSEAWFGSADKIRESDGMKSVRQWFKDFGSYLGDVGMVFVDWGKKIWGGLKQIGSSFVSVGKVIWNAISYVFYEPGIDGMIVGAITWIGEWIWKGLKKIGDAFYWLYDYLVGHSVVPDMVNGIVSWISSLPGKVIGFIWGMVTKVASFFNDMALKTLATIRGWAPQLGAAMTSIYTTITGWILSAVNKVKSWFTGMKNSTVATVTSWWTSLAAKFTAIRDGVKARINSLVNSVKERFTNMKNSTVATVTGWWTSLAAKFNSIRDGVRSRISSMVASVKERFTNMKNTVNKTVSGWVSDVRSKFSNLREKIVSTARSTRNDIVDVWNDMKKKAIKAFTGMKDGIKEVWNKVKKVARDPVKFMAHTVYNDGIVAVYRKIRSVVPALPELKKIQLGKEWFAKGGIMPGYTPGRDVHTVPGPRGPVGLSGGEAIMRPEWTKAVGPDFVHGMNAIARKRGSQGVKQALTPNPQTVHQVKELGKKATAQREPSPMGYAKGGILGKVNEFVGKAKSKLAEGFMSFATPALNGLTDGLKDRFGKGALPNVPYHLMSSVIIPKMLSFLQEKEDEEIGGGTGTAADVVGLARKSVGKYPESGGNNTNAITRWFGMNGAPWCAMFISWLFDKAGASPALKKAKRTAWTGDYYTSGMKKVPEKDRKPGDVAVYGVDHVNLVENKKYRIGGNEGNNVSRSGRRGGTIFRPDWSKAGGAGGGSGNTVMTSFWDSHQPMANGKRMHSSAVASSVLPLGTKIRVKVGSKSATGSIDDLGPSSFVYRRHHPKAVLDLAEPMMQKLTGRRSNVVNGSFSVTKRGTGRTLFGYTNWSGKYSPGKSTKGFADGGIMSGSHDIGGLLPDKGVAVNRSGEAEVVQTLSQLQTMARLAENEQIVINGDVNFTVDAKSIKDIQDVINVVKGIKTTSRANRGRVSRDGF